MGRVDLALDLGLCPWIKGVAGVSPGYMDEVLRLAQSQSISCVRPTWKWPGMSDGAGVQGAGV